MHFDGQFCVLKHGLESLEQLPPLNPKPQIRTYLDGHLCVLKHGLDSLEQLPPLLVPRHGIHYEEDVPGPGEWANRVGHPLNRLHRRFSDSREKTDEIFKVAVLPNMICSNNRKGKCSVESHREPARR
jgi:hypothetical protein